MSPRIKEVSLDPGKQNAETLDLQRRLTNKIIGQDEAVNQLVDMFQVYLSGMSAPGRPIGNLLFLGPTGSGKTRIVEVMAESLFGNPRAFVKIDCAEFQHSHEISKLIGSPPGYLGHRETPPMLTQEILNQSHTERLQMSFILFDEIEKANHSLWQLMLGMMDKGVLTLGDNRRVDLSRCIIFMTSNLGAKEMSRISNNKGIGFTSGRKHDDLAMETLNKKLHNAALEATRKRFSPEFINRLDKIVVFRTLTEDNLRLIVDIELNAIQNRILASQPERQFAFKCTSEAKDFLLREGTDPQYGARHLNRALEKHLVYPLSSLISTKQIHYGDMILVGLDKDFSKLTFSLQMEATAKAHR